MVPARANKTGSRDPTRQAGTTQRNKADQQPARRQCIAQSLPCYTAHCKPYGSKYRRDYRGCWEAITIHPSKSPEWMHAKETLIWGGHFRSKARQEQVSASPNSQLLARLVRLLWQACAGSSWPIYLRLPGCPERRFAGVVVVRGLWTCFHASPGLSARRFVAEKLRA